MITAELAEGLAAVGPEWDPLFAAGPGLQSRRAWFAASAAAALPDPAAARVLLVRNHGEPLALLPLVAGTAGLRSLTTPYTCLFQPLVAPGTADAALRGVGQALGRCARAWPMLVLEALDPAWPGLPPMLAGLRDAGLAVRRFDHFGNWFLPVSGWTWAEYLASRPGPLRETIRRKTRLAGRDPSVRLEIVRDAAALPAALQAYESVHDRSWKGAEPFPLFNRALVGSAGGLNALRVAVMWAGDDPVAAQLWSVTDGTAQVMKLAYVATAKPLSPGTVLTAAVIRSVLDGREAAELDFGRGDDAYKKDWADKRRQRIGILVANPRRLAGLRVLARHDGGRLYAALATIGHRTGVLRRIGR